MPFLTPRSGQCGERPDQPDVHFDDRKLQRRAEQLEQGAFGRAGEDEGEGEEGREEEEQEGEERQKEEAREEQGFPLATQVQEDSAEQDGEHVLLRGPECDSWRLAQR